MKPEPDDTTLRGQFQSLRQADAQRTPAFDRIATDRAVRWHVPWAPLAAAALFVIAVGVHRMPTSVATPAMAPAMAATTPAPEVSLSGWQAASDQWLTLPGAEWMTTAPEFDSTISEITASRVFDAPSFEEAQTEEDEV